MLSTIKAAILADGEIDKQEVLDLEGIIFADGQVDQAEMDVLFELNEECDTYCPEFTALFVKAGVSFCLEDEATPGVVDADEAAYLINAIMNDDLVDDNERALLTAVKAGATSIDAALVAKMDELNI